MPASAGSVRSQMRPPGRQRLQGVDDQVEDDLIDLLGIAERRRLGGRRQSHVEADLLPLALAPAAKSAARDSTSRSGVGSRRCSQRAGELDEAGDDALDAIDLGDDRLDQLGIVAPAATTPGRASIWAEERMTLSGVRTSCATIAASSPAKANLAADSASSWLRFSSVVIRLNESVSWPTSLRDRTGSRGSSRSGCAAISLVARVTSFSGRMTWRASSAATASPTHAGWRR